MPPAVPPPVSLKVSLRVPCRFPLQSCRDLAPEGPRAMPLVPAAGVTASTASAEAPGSR